MLWLLSLPFRIVFALLGAVIGLVGIALGLVGGLIAFLLLPLGLLLAGGAWLLLRVVRPRAHAIG